jgi:hypothetical protein
MFPVTCKLFLIVHLLLIQAPVDSSYLNWSQKQAIDVGKRMRASSRVSGTGRGIFNTEKSISYKIRATWLSQEVVQATARLQQIRSRLSDEETKEIVSKARLLSGKVFLIEIDPDEGSGVVPSDWEAFLQPKRTDLGRNDAVAGINNSALRNEVAFAGVYSRDYNYDLYWVVFLLCTKEGKPLFTDADKEAELILRIEQKEGKIRFPIPDSMREKVDCERYTVDRPVQRSNNRMQRSAGSE